MNNDTQFREKNGFMEARNILNPEWTVVGPVSLYRDADIESESKFKNPEWDKTEKVHGWRNYISDRIQKIWDTFDDFQKEAIFKNAQDIADKEEWE